MTMAIDGFDMPAESGSMGTFVLRLRLGPREPFVGSIGRAGQAHELRFHGWIAFMSAIDTLRSDGTESPLDEAGL
jgi:hypothetical protein